MATYTLVYDYKPPVQKPCTALFSAQGRHVPLLTNVNGPSGLGLDRTIGYESSVWSVNKVDLPGDLGWAEYDWDCIIFRESNGCTPPNCCGTESASVWAVTEKRVHNGKTAMTCGQPGIDCCLDPGVDCWTYARGPWCPQAPAVDPDVLPCSGGACPDNEQCHFLTNPSKVSVTLPRVNP